MEMICTVGQISRMHIWPFSLLDIYIQLEYRNMIEFEPL